jgi:hypothetical protein
LFVPPRSQQAEVIVTEREQYEAWFSVEFSSLTSRSGVGFDLAKENGFRIWQASRRAALEEAACQWDGCFYDGVGERIEIGAAIRALVNGETNE